MTDDGRLGRLARVTTKVVEAYVGKNETSAAELPALMSTIYHALYNAESGSAAPEPAVPIKNSIIPDYLICLEDGKKMKMLKRHLKTAHDLTPDDYRRRWNLPASYPITAPNYAKRRSVIA